MKIFLQYVVPLAFPIAIYLVWRLFSKKEERKPIDKTTMLKLLGVGVVLTLASLIAFNQLASEDPGGVYQPPQLIDGKVVPGKVIRDE